MCFSTTVNSFLFTAFDFRLGRIVALVDRVYHVFTPYKTVGILLKKKKKNILLVSLQQSDDDQKSASRPVCDLTALHVHMLTERFTEGHLDHNDE